MVTREARRTGHVAHGRAEKANPRRRESKRAVLTGGGRGWRVAAQGDGVRSGDGRFWKWRWSLYNVVNVLSAPSLYVLNR